ncbi:MAG: hypothetical protein V1744_00800 [Candidatus Altiarchaeota archaeon]
MKTEAVIIMLLVGFAAADSVDLENADYGFKADAITQSLTEAGITESQVNVTAAKVVVSYRQPKVKSDMDALLAWTYILAASALNHPDSTEVTVIQYAQDVPLAQASAKTSDIKDYVAKKTTFKQFSAKVTVKPPPKTKYTPCQKNAELVGSECFCKDGYEPKNGACTGGLIPEISTEDALKIGLIAALIAIPVIGLLALALLALIILIAVIYILKKRRNKKKKGEGNV